MIHESSRTSGPVETPGLRVGTVVSMLKCVAVYPESCTHEGRELNFLMTADGSKDARRSIIAAEQLTLAY